ncbi:hypothetical protein RCL1_005511 [Eukaryota sp. TZLM3-RCL]
MAIHFSQSLLRFIFLFALSTGFYTVHDQQLRLEFILTFHKLSNVSFYFRQTIEKQLHDISEYVKLAVPVHSAFFMSSAFPLEPVFIQFNLYKCFKKLNVFFDPLLSLDVNFNNLLSTLSAPIDSYLKLQNVINLKICGIRLQHVQPLCDVLSNFCPTLRSLTINAFQNSPNGIPNEIVFPGDFQSLEDLNLFFSGQNTPRVYTHSIVFLKSIDLHNCIWDCSENQHLLYIRLNHVRIYHTLHPECKPVFLRCVNLDTQSISILISYWDNFCVL